jgi:hypothetical protein
MKEILENPNPEEHYWYDEPKTDFKGTSLRDAAPLKEKPKDKE